MNYVTYYRVSTKQQGSSGLGMDAQCEAVAKFLKQHGGRELATFREIESGKRDSRPQLTAALLRCRQTHATLLVAKLDRLSRNAAFLMNLRESGVEFKALDLPDVTTLTLGVLATIAQHERETISARTKAALAARKARGLPMGTPSNLPPPSAYTAARAAAGNVARANARAELLSDVVADAKAQGCTTLRAIAAHLNGLGIQTPRKAAWTPIGITRLIRRLDAS